MTTMQGVFTRPLEEPGPVTLGELAALDHLLRLLEIRARGACQVGVLLELSRARYKLAAETEKLRKVKP